MLILEWKKVFVSNLYQTRTLVKSKYNLICQVSNKQNLKPTKFKCVVKVQGKNFSHKRKRIYIQGVLLPVRQMLRGDSRHEDKHY